MSPKALPLPLSMYAARTMGLLPCYSCVGLLRWALLLLPLSLSGVLGDCGIPNMPNFVTLRSGTLNDTYPVGTVLQYRCIPGYERIPGTAPSIRCQDDSTWSEAPTFCRKRKCRPPHIDNGRIISTGELELGEEITFTCDNGYRLIGQEKIRCVVSDSVVDWSREPPLCQTILCFPPPAIANGRHTGDDRDEYTHGTAVTYTCNAGLSLIGSASVSCTTAENGVDGKWSPAAPECKVVECKRPIIENGRVASVFQATYKHENTLRIECNADHTLEGEDFITCGADSLWHPAVPTCVRLPPIRPTLTPTRRTTTGTEKTGSTKRPDVTDHKPGSGSSKTVGFVLGAGFAVIIVVGAAIIIAKKCHKKGKSDLHPGSSGDYHMALKKDEQLEEKEP